MRSYIFGHSANNIPILAHRFGGSGPEVLLLGGVHGDELEGVEAATALLGRWINSFPFRLRLTLVPIFNPDGLIRANRLNGNGVDLNRNMATHDWTAEIANPRYNPGPSADSEPETQALVQWLASNKPVFILSLHSWKPMLNVNGDCLREAQAISGVTGYTIHDSIGYPTPGCLGTYCGLEREIPTLTYEIERGLKTADILRIHVPAIEEALKATEANRRKVL